MMERITRERIRGVAIGLVLGVCVVICVAARYEDLHVTLLRLGDPAVAITATGTEINQLDADGSGLTNMPALSNANMNILCSNIVLRGNLSVAGVGTATTFMATLHSGTLVHVTSDMDAGGHMTAVSNVVGAAGQFAGTVTAGVLRATTSTSITANASTVNVATANVIGEAVVDGKYATVGADATTGIMIDAFAGTLEADGLQTQAFAAVFGAATPIVVAMYSEDPGAATSIYAISRSASNCVLQGAASKGYYGVARGERP